MYIYICIYICIYIVAISLHGLTPQHPWSSPSRPQSAPGATLRPSSPGSVQRCPDASHGPVEAMGKSCMGDVNAIYI